MPAQGERSRTRDRTRHAVLRAAIDVLSVRPAASLAEVATAAGVARSTLHRYYPDRATLRTAIDSFVVAEFAAAVERARVHEGTGLAAYTRLCGELLDGHDVFAWWMPAVSAEPDDATDTAEDRVVAGVVRRGHADGSIDPALDADWLVWHIWCTLYAAFYLPETDARSAREAREMCLRTLRKTAAA